MMKVTKLGMRAAIAMVQIATSHMHNSILTSIRN
jgi:hypothetical protein